MGLERFGEVMGFTRTEESLCAVQLERAACCDERHAARAQVRTEFPDLDEVLFFGLCRVELVREGIASEIV